MPIQFKSKLSSVIANATWLDKTIDDATVGKFSLREDSSAHIEDIQLFLNTLRANVDSNDVELADHETRISDNETTILDHETRIGVNETNISTNTADILTINNSLGQPNGIATLAGDGKVPASQLPSYVDDVEEYADLASFPVTGETGKIYVALDTLKTYRWSGSAYVEISASDVNSVNGQTGVVVLDKTDIGLTDVTDDSQLKRASGDLNTFTEKVTPVIDDIVLIEDSEDSFNKKKVKLSNMLGGGGEGGLNYILNTDFEVDTANHVPYKDSASPIPDSGTGGAPTLSIARSLVAPLAGLASGVISKPASNTQGEGISIHNSDFDIADRGTIQIISFKYDGSDANYNDGDLRVYFKDETNSNVIRINGEDIKGGNGTHYARVQVPIDCVNGSVLVHCAVTHVDAFEFKYDRVSFAPQIISQGAIITDKMDITAEANATLKPVDGGTLDGTYTYYEYGRIGDEVVIKARFNSTVAGSGSGLTYFPLPSGIKALSNYQNIGVAQTFNVNYTAGNQFRTSGNSINGALDGIYIFNQGSGSIAVGSTYLSSSQIYLNVRFKVQGWSSQSAMSSDFGGRDVSLTARGGNITVITASVTNIPFTTVEDTTSSWNGTQFKAPEGGVYSISGMIAASASNSSNIRSCIDGVLKEFVYLSGNDRYKSFAFDQELKKGELLSLRGDLTFTNDNSTVAHNLNINKRSSSQQILETELVAARYTSDSGQLINPAGDGQVILYEDKDYDTHGIYNPLTGVLKIPITGKYHVSPSFHGLLQDQEAQRIYIFKNGALLLGEERYGSRSSANQSISVNESINLDKGDELEFYADTSGVSFNLSTFSRFNSFSIYRIK